MVDVGRLIILGACGYVAYRMVQEKKVEEEVVAPPVEEVKKPVEEEAVIPPEAMPPEEVPEKHLIPLKEAERKAWIEGIEEEHRIYGVPEGTPDYLTAEEYDLLPPEEKKKHYKAGDVYVSKEKYFGVPKTLEQLETAKRAKYYVAIDPATGGVIGTIPVDHPNAEITKQAWEYAGFVVETMTGEELSARGITPIYG